MSISKLIDEARNIEGLLNGNNVKVYHYCDDEEFIIEAFASCEKTGKNLRYSMTTPVSMIIDAKFSYLFFDSIIDDFIYKWNNEVAKCR